MFTNAEKLLKLCKEQDKTIFEITIDSEVERSDDTREEIVERMECMLEIMKESSTAGLDKEIESMGGLLSDESKKLEEYRASGKGLSGETMLRGAARALSVSQVNASMGKIVASPTAGGAGIVPAVLLSLKDKLDLNDEQIVNGLFTSAGVGSIIAENATISGAEGGCQAECGASSAMAAAAIVEIMGGTPSQAFNASAFALTNIMGLVCDPVAGLVEYPCALRNASGVSNAYISADLALAGVESLVPFDEVVDAMFEVGNAMPTTLKETALGGVAATPTGEREKARVLGTDKK